jgi:hypothetical protein
MTLNKKREKQEKVLYEQKNSAIFIIHMFAVRILVKLHRRRGGFMVAQRCECMSMYAHKA